ncbi:hypothetical protein N4T77_14840 [Clostridium sp. CX1]|uniref:hypothetical protein n=1 Tax=Clostridium sp. CX1 TaxID=2978346 RepID=UPI0021BED10C|nr:hypothetical protein [Clostridium sp. CX1]MCT8977874.1 hypothetical protein [Clostridium sp. CX1]
MYITEFLLKNSRIVTELCIKSKKEYRLWQELKRINSDVYTKVNKKIDSDSRIDGFNICVNDGVINDIAPGA